MGLLAGRAGTVGAIGRLQVAGAVERNEDAVRPSVALGEVDRGRVGDDRDVRAEGDEAAAVDPTTVRLPVIATASAGIVTAPIVRPATGRTAGRRG